MNIMYADWHLQVEQAFVIYETSAHPLSPFVLVIARYCLWAICPAGAVAASSASCRLKYGQAFKVIELAICCLWKAICAIVPCVWAY